MHGVMSPMHEAEAGKTPTLATEHIPYVGHSTAPGNSIIISIVSKYKVLGECPVRNGIHLSSPTSIVF
jgi:hypothetical protein